MITAVYTHRQPSNEMLAIIKSAVEGDSVITNFPLPMGHTRYVFGNKPKTKASVWGSGAVVHKVSTDEFPFDWMNPDVKLAGIVAALARDSERILLLFPQKSEIPVLLLVMACAYNKTVRVFQGTTPVAVTPELLNNNNARVQYGELILPSLDPLPVPTRLMQAPNGTVVRRYQQQMINFGLSHPSSGWFVDMGLGKTLATLVLLNEWMVHGEIDATKPILIVAPIMVALDTWSREAKKWGYDWDIKINIRPTPKKREKMLQELLLPMEKPTLFLTNPDQLGPIKDYYFSFNIPLPFEVLIIDELSMFKSPTAKRNEMVSYYRRGAKKFLGLTGTPASNHLLNVWNQLKLISRSDTQWAGNTIYDFQEKFFVPVAKNAKGFTTKWEPKFGAENTIFRNLSKHAISMKTEGLVDLPEISFSNLFIDLPESARKEYETLETEIAETLEEGQSTSYTTKDGCTIFLPNSDVLSGKLLQIAGGALYTDTATHAFATFHDEKLNALDDLVESATSPLLVFYYFESDLVRIQKKYKNRIPVLDSKDKNVQELITKWNNGEIPVLLAHPASVGHGLNLQEGGHTIVWFSLPNWDNDKYQQANKRLYRSGQTHAVTVTHIVAKNTIEEVMLRSLKNKEKTNSRLMSALDRAERGNK